MKLTFPFFTLTILSATSFQLPNAPNDDYSCEKLFSDALEKSNNNLVVVYFTSSWCGSCQTIAQPLLNLKKRYGFVKFYKFDADHCMELTMRENIRYLPTFKLFKFKRELVKLEGSNLKKLEMYIQQYTTHT